MGMVAGLHREVLHLRRNGGQRQREQHDSKSKGL
jgi:hypothetical protein